MIPSRAIPGTRRIALGAVLALILAGWGAPGHASPLELFGFGGRSPGLAGAGAADSTDYEATFLNPAGLADARTRHLAYGPYLGDLDLRIDRDEVKLEHAKGDMIGVSLPIPLAGWWRGRVGLGLGFVVPRQTVARIEAPLPGTPTFTLLASRAHILGVALGVGVKLDERWKVGGGILALAGLSGSLFIDVDGAGRITSNSEERLISDFAPILGAELAIPEHALRVGFTLRGASQCRYDIHVTNALAKSLPLSLPELRIAGVAQYDPLTLLAEAAWQVRPELELIGQLGYARWSAFPLPTENPLVGGAPQDPPGFHDTAVPRAAIEWRGRRAGAELSARAGYAFLWSPAPEASGRQSFLDNDRHELAIGAGIAWPGAARWPVHLDVWFQAHVLQHRRHQKDLSLFDDAHPAPFDRLYTAGHIFVGGVVAGIDL